MVHFPGLSSPTYGFSWRYSGMSLSGLPHSDILGSKPVCGSPKLFAAYHVLHRLLAPRHSPYALSSLTIFILKLEISAARCHGDRELRKSLAHCVVCGRKTTVCRIFSCKRTNEAFGVRRRRRHRVAAMAILLERIGEYRARTGDLLVANQALSQLS